MAEDWASAPSDATAAETGVEGAGAAAGGGVVEVPAGGVAWVRLFVVPRPADGPISGPAGAEVADVDAAEMGDVDGPVGDPEGAASGV